MGRIKRIYVEKKEKYAVEAARCLESLQISGLESVRIINRYDVEGLTDEDFNLCVSTVFSEPPVDIVHNDGLRLDNDDFAFAVKYLPGQYDQRADSAAQCAQAVTGGEKPIIETAKVYICRGRLSEADKERIKKYYINSVDSMEAPHDLPETLAMSAEPPKDVEAVKGFIDLPEDGILKTRADMGLAMSAADLMFCQKYFKETEQRDPTVTEIRVIDTYWSDHCRHTTFLTRIENVSFDGGSLLAKPVEEAYRLYLSERKAVYGNTDRPVTLMDAAVMGMKGLKAKGLLPDLDESEEINACSIVADVDVNGVNEQYLIMFKNETHNHPTEIEPFGGAATCLGGAIRDPLSGRSYVYQAMRVTGSGDPRTPSEHTIQGKLPQRKISTEAAAGYSSYGNQIGLATGQVTEIYHKGYVAKRMEIGAVVGAAKREHVVRERPKAGDVVVLVGGRTGRDGLGGATGSSKEHTEESILTCGAEVQKGNAPTERKLQRLFRNPEVSRMIKRCNDFGAGGVCVAVGELADGLDIKLDNVLKKYEGLDGTELAISESQERMAVVVDKDDADSFIKHAENENLEAVAVADVTDSRRLKMKWRGKLIVDISRDFLDTNGAIQTADVSVAEPEPLPQYEYDADLKTAWLDNLKRLNVAAQKGLAERFDSTIGNGTVLMPFGGKHQLTPAEVMAAKVPVLDGFTNTATMMAFGFNPYISEKSPFHGAMYAVVESISRIVAAGGSFDTIRLSFQEYFERLGNDPYRWGKPFSALLGAFYAQMALGVPSIGGKDSMSGTFKDMDVPPTLVSFALNTAKTGHIISPEFKKTGSKIIRINAGYNECSVPDFDKLKSSFDIIHRLIKEKSIISAHTVGVGGMAAAVSRMCFGNGIGADIQTESNLFGENYGGFIIELEGDETLLNGLDFEALGETVADDAITVNGIKITLDEAAAAWLSVFEGVYPTELFKKQASAEDIPPFYAKRITTPKEKTAKPRVFIPVFPGTNCEYDTAERFEKAGAVVDTFVVKNLNINMLKQSVCEMAARIGQSQIIALPGGFSAGDEPEGSGKFIAAVFQNGYVAEAVMSLLDKRGGLILGICNGAQALIKLGLVPYGEIRPMSESSPTLTFNAIGRHISTIAKTKIISNLSPWFGLVNVSDVYNTVVSHGEGRFAAERSVIDELIKNGQVATQYVDFNGNASNDIRFNPNGSVLSIEGITSPDGRVLAKMGHSERIGEGLYKNVPGDYDQKIFEAGVRYFK